MDSANESVVSGLRQTADVHCSRAIVTHLQCLVFHEAPSTRQLRLTVLSKQTEEI